MTDLDRRVATLRGWHWDHVRMYWGNANGNIVAFGLYSPETNLIEAFALWNEARPEGWRILVRQSFDGDWLVCRNKCYEEIGSEIVSLADLPRAIAEAWCEAKEGR